MPAALPLCFSDAELDLLARTADALSAYLGKPVLAEVIAEEDIGAECVLFALPLQPGEDDGDVVKVGLGGPEARFLGNRGGLEADDDTLECELLWAVQLSDLEGVRFIKLDRYGEEVAWVAELAEILPFALSEPLMQSADDDAEDDDGQEDTDTEDRLAGETPPGHQPGDPHTLH